MRREHRAQVFRRALFARNRGRDILRARLFNQCFNTGARPRAQFFKKTHWQPP